MPAANALALFTNMLDQLKQVEIGLKSVDQSNRHLVANGASIGGNAKIESAKTAARCVAAKAVEVARNAVMTCSRFDEPAKPPRSRAN
jgi:hypothetical protein